LIHRSPNALLSSDAHQFNESAQREEEAAADALGGLTRIMIVPNQVRGINYNSTAARELVSVPDQTLCGPAFVGGVYSHCQDNAMRWTRANSTNIRGFSATAWFTGKAIRSRLGDGFANVPIGLVRSSWGGARQPMQQLLPSPTTKTTTTTTRKRKKYSQQHRYLSLLPQPPHFLS
jgi:hypothetical protein